MTYPKDPEVTGAFYSAKKHYRRLLKQKRKAYRDKLITDLEQMSDSNPEQYWKLLADLKNENNRSNKRCDPFLLEEWANYFKTLHSDKHTVTANRETQITQNVRNMELAPTFCELDFTITQHEIKDALKRLKNKKSPGIDGITSEMLKSGQDVLMPALLKVFNHIFRSGSYPETWRTGLLSPIHKKL